jgi:hypothetical protein
MMGDTSRKDSEGHEDLWQKHSNHPGTYLYEELEQLQRIPVEYCLRLLRYAVHENLDSVLQHMQLCYMTYCPRAVPLVETMIRWRDGTQ